jgi:hypothetical protein
MMLASVLDVRVRSERDEARREIINATADAPPGTRVRLTVGINRPPLWLSHSIRRDLYYQVDSRSIEIIRLWHDALGAG